MYVQISVKIWNTCELILIQDFTLQPTYIYISFHQTAINAWIWSAIFHAKDTNFTEVSINYKIVNL